MSRRISRLSEVLKFEISQIILKDLQDPRLGWITITAVEISEDLRHATIYISVLGNEEDWQNSFLGLESAKKYIRAELGKRVRIKFLPEIEFKPDKTLEEGARIFEILEKIKEERESS